jgi:hypothetical protein
MESLRLLRPFANGLYIDRLWPNLLQFDFAALVRQDQLHSLDQVRTKGCLSCGRFLGHYIAILSDESMRGYSGSIFVSGTTVLFRSPSAKVTNGADFLYFSMSASGRITIAQFVTSKAKIR